VLCPEGSFSRCRLTISSAMVRLSRVPAVVFDSDHRVDSILVDAKGNRVSSLGAKHPDIRKPGHLDLQQDGAAGPVAGRAQEPEAIRLGEGPCRPDVDHTIRLIDIGSIERYIPAAESTVQLPGDTRRGVEITSIVVDPDSRASGWTGA